MNPVRIITIVVNKRAMVIHLSALFQAVLLCAGIAYETLTLLGDRPGIWLNVCYLLANYYSLTSSAPWVYRKGWMAILVISLIRLLFEAFGMGQFYPHKVDSAVCLAILIFIGHVFMRFFVKMKNSNQLKNTEDV